MKKQNIQIFTLIFFLSFSFKTYSQSGYTVGFNDGYKKGYCYNDFSCIPPIPPTAPIPSVNENYNSYQDGYNRGFQMGLDAKRSHNSNSNNNQNTYRKVVPSPSYIPPIDLNAYANSVIAKDRIIKERMEYLAERLRYLRELDDSYSDCYHSEMSKVKEMMLIEFKYCNLIDNYCFADFNKKFDEFERVFKINSEKCIQNLNSK